MNYAKQQDASFKGLIHYEQRPSVSKGGFCLLTLHCVQYRAKDLLGKWGGIHASAFDITLLIEMNDHFHHLSLVRIMLI